MERLGFQVGTWNVDSLTGRAVEVAEALTIRKVDVDGIGWNKFRQLVPFLPIRIYH